MSKKANGLVSLATVALVAVNGFAGFYEGKTDADRIAALSELSVSDLTHVIYNEHLSTAGFFDKMSQPNNSMAVKIAAAEQLYKRGEIYKLVNMAGDYHLSDGSKFGGEFPAAIQKMFTTEEGLDKLCEVCEEGRSTDASRMLLHMVCGNNETFLVYAVKHSKRQAISQATRNIMGLIERIQSADGLWSIISDANCEMDFRIKAAVMAFSKINLATEGVVNVLSQFEKDEHALSVVSTMAFRFARQRDNADMVAAIQEKTIGCVKETMARAESRAKRQYVLSGYYVGMEGWRADLLTDFFGMKGVENETTKGDVTKFTFSRDFFDGNKKFAFGDLDYEAWAMRFVQASNLSKQTKVQKDEDGQITFVDRGVWITLNRKSGIVSSVTVEDESQIKAKARAAKASAEFMAAFNNALMQSGWGGGQMPMQQSVGGGQVQNATAQSMQKVGKKSIFVAKQEGDRVRAYDSNGTSMFSVTGVLQGYTSDTVSVKEGDRVRVYDVDGMCKGSF